MDYLADTVAIVRHLCNHPALGREAARIFRDADAGVNRLSIGHHADGNLVSVRGRSD